MSRFLLHLSCVLRSAVPVSPSLSKITVTLCPNLTLARPLSNAPVLLVGVPQEKIPSLLSKKRPVKKRKLAEDDAKLPNVVAYATAEEYDLEKLSWNLTNEGLYEPRTIENDADVVHAVAKYKVDDEPRDIFFFREGSVVLWNTGELEIGNLLQFLKKHEVDSYTENLVQQESEVMNYDCHKDADQSTVLSKDGHFLLQQLPPEKLTLIKYTISNAMASSVKLGIWEAMLEQYIESIEFVTEDLKRGNRIKMTREEVLRKHGELFALRHVINLSSDLLDTPDFYWENEKLEAFYLQVCNYFGINKRTRVMNEKINHCVELIELLSSHLSDKHHVRLEWMIIVLIMVEVAFEIIHYVSLYVEDDHKTEFVPKDL